MCLCVCAIYMFVCVHMYVQVYWYICIYVYEGQRFTLVILGCFPLHCGCVYVYVCVHMSVCIMYMFICMHMYVQVHWYICIYVYGDQQFTLGILGCSSLSFCVCIICMYADIYLCIYVFIHV